jgi:hypothetical protein
LQAKNNGKWIYNSTARNNLREGIITVPKELCMTVKNMVWKTMSTLALIVLLAGCAAPTALPPTPTALPTIDTRPTFEAIATQSAATVIADLTLNAPTATPVPPTETPAPTATQGPTNTPVPTSTPTRVFIPWTATPTATQAAYACSVTAVSPSSTDTIKVDQDFDAKWTLKNTGTSTWLAGNTDIAFVDGTKMHTIGDLKDLTEDVAPNGTTSVTIDMKAPSGDGTFKTSWAVRLEGGVSCALNLTINVSK